MLAARETSVLIVSQAHACDAPLVISHHLNLFGDALGNGEHVSRTTLMCQQKYATFKMLQLKQLHAETRRC